MLSPNEKIQRAFYSIQKKLNDNNVETLGTKSSNTFLVNLVRDKYQNSEYKIIDYKPISVYIQFPGEEIPTPTMGTDNNQTGNSVLHMYDLLPIIAKTKFSDSVKVGNVILYKVKQPNDSFSILILEFISVISKATRVGVISQDWIVAMPTDYSLYNKPEFKAILEEYKKSDLW